MNIVLDTLDDWAFDRVYRDLYGKLLSLSSLGTADGSAGANMNESGYGELNKSMPWTRINPVRQFVTLSSVLWISSTLLYLLFGWYGFYFHRATSSKALSKRDVDQVKQEMAKSFCVMTLLSFATAPIFIAQLHGYAKIYQYGSGSEWYEAAQYPLFVVFSDTAMYWLHRMFHHPVLFRTIHKTHHRFASPTAFSAYAFHPVEAFIMSLPVYAYSFFWPMSDVAQLVVFAVSSIWPFLLHDDSVPFHLVHHRNVNLNFGQFLPIWDQLANTYCDPTTFFGSNEVPATSK